MITMEQVQKLSQDEKLRAIEVLWDGLIQSGEPVQSPDWHADALQETEARFDQGLETPVDWDTAKRELRKEFE